MYNKKFYFICIACLIFYVDAKKFRRSKRPKPEEDSTPQPNVVTYSTFGFNDVGNYEGFVPSSPDYVNHLNTFNQDSSTRLYAPAFPTALDNYPPQSQNGQFDFEDDGGPQASMLQYPQSSMSFSNTPNFENEPQNPNNGPEIYGRNAGEVMSPIYGTKLSSKSKNKHFSNFSSDDNLFSSPSENKYSYHEVQSAYDSKPSSFGDPNKNNFYYSVNYATTHPPSNINENDNYMKPEQSNSQSNLKFPRVVDFTKYKHLYPTELSTTTTKGPNTYKTLSNGQNDFFKEFEELSTKFPSVSHSFRESFKDKDAEIPSEKEKLKPSISYTSTSYGSNPSPNYLNYHNSENSFKDNKPNIDYKDNFKYNNFASSNSSNEFKNWKNPVKGYQYSTNFSNMNFEFDFTGGKKLSNNNNDEVVPASSNVVDLTSYQFPDTDYSTFKKFPSYKGHQAEELDNAYELFKSQGYKYDPEEYVKSLYTTLPTPSSIWSNNFKHPEFPSYKPYKKPQYGEEIGDDVVHIPKRPYSSKHSYGSKPSEWSTYTSHRPYKSRKPSNWNKEVPTRFKSEEDLLGLRTHDTSHPTYLPTYKPEINSLVGDLDYKKLVDKWRQLYLSAKYKDAGLREYEGFASETKPMHVPVPKPYPIEVPRPVIVPVPQPYPVRVPVPNPVAVPVVRELKVPIEKPVPYPVIKKVPYPVEKHVPVPVEKEVKVPVIKPYPVMIPHIRPVFHHSRPGQEEMEAIDEEDDYFPRPERPERESSKKIPYAKRPRSTRNRSRRPTRMYTERNRRRRWPQRRPADRPRRPELPVSYKHYEHDFEDFEHTHSEYILHCKRTGNC